jgi:hypothetical protein
MELVDYLNNVNNHESFIEFVKVLAKDKEINSIEWQNLTIEDYLDCANSWLEDSECKDISWKLMAEFLYCGKIYE